MNGGTNLKLSFQIAVTILGILLITNGEILPANAADFDHSKFDRILKTYVDTEGRVDYNGISADSALGEYMKSLGNAKEPVK